MLSQLKLAGLCAGGFFVVCLMLALHMERVHAHKLERRNAELSAQLDAISAKRAVQRQVTRDNIVTVTKTIHDADGRAKVIEQAPLPGNCKTPPEIIGADL